MQLIVGERIVSDLADRLADLAPQVELLPVAEDGRSTAELDHAEALLLAGVTGEGRRHVLDQARGLRWVHAGSAGVESLPFDLLRERNITLTNSAGVFAIPIAEWVLHALLMIAKRGPQMVEAQQQRRWADDVDFDELGGKTLTILGIGGIGQEIARRAAAFDMRVWGINRSGNTVPHVERIISGDDWRDALRDTDYLVIATPLTESTRNLIGEREIDMLSDHAWVINIARGAIIDEPALIAALQRGTIGGAALDTFVQEPLPGDSPLWTLPNVIISPHHSGSSPRSEQRMLDLFVDNLRRFVNGEELENVVDLEAGY